MASAVASGVDRDQLRQRGARKGEKVSAEPSAVYSKDTKKEEREVVDGSVSEIEEPLHDGSDIFWKEGDRELQGGVGL